MDDLILIEGDEEVEYVVVEFPQDLEPEGLTPGTRLVLQGMDTQQPKILVGDKALLGQYECCLGSLVAVQPSTTADGPTASYVGHTETQLVFQSNVDPQQDATGPP